MHLNCLFPKGYHMHLLVGAVVRGEDLFFRQVISHYIHLVHKIVQFVF